MIARLKVSLQVRTRKSRIDIMDGLRSFIEADNHSAVDVGGLRRGTISVHVKKPQFSEVFPKAVIREGADELTLRAVGSRRTFIDTKHIRSRGGNRRWWMRIGTLFSKGLERKEWEALYYHCRELYQATGTKKLGDGQKAKALWTMTAARDRDDELFMIQLVRMTFKEDLKPYWTCGKNTLKVPWQR